MISRHVLLRQSTRSRALTKLPRTVKLHRLASTITQSNVDLTLSQHRYTFSHPSVRSIDTLQSDPRLWASEKNDNPPPPDPNEAPSEPTPKTPDQKPKHERTPRQPVDKEPRKSSVSSSKSSSSKSSAAPPSNNDNNRNDDDPPAPPPEPIVDQPENYFEHASAADKKQVMILPINKRPLIPGMYLPLNHSDLFSNQTNLFL